MSKTAIPRSAPLAALRGAGKRYGAVTALADADIDVHAGEVLAVLGADSGHAELFGGDPREASARRGIGVMLQETRLPDTLRVAEHVHLFSSYYANPRPVDETLRLAGLTDLAKRPYAALSGGQQRRVQFALAICGRPALLFVDEPTVGLDVEARRGLWQVLRQLRADGAGIVLTTHYLEEADVLADRIVLLAGGRVLAQDTPAGIKSRAASRQVSARTTLDIAQVAAFAEAESVLLEDGVVRVRCRDAEALLRRWLAADAALADLDVRGLNLEDAFLSLTSTPGMESQS